LSHGKSKLTPSHTAHVLSLSLRRRHNRDKFDQKSWISPELGNFLLNPRATRAL
jgi:hypothetical protein